MREFCVFAGIVLNVLALAVVVTGGAVVDSALLWWGGATSIVLGMYIDSI